MYEHVVVLCSLCTAHHHHRHRAACSFTLSRVCEFVKVILMLPNAAFFANARHIYYVAVCCCCCCGCWWWRGHCWPTTLVCLGKFMRTPYAFLLLLLVSIYSGLLYLCFNTCFYWLLLRRFAFCTEGSAHAYQTHIHSTHMHSHRLTDGRMTETLHSLVLFYCRVCCALHSLFSYFTWNNNNNISSHSTHSSSSSDT